MIEERIIRAYQPPPIRPRAIAGRMRVANETPGVVGHALVGNRHQAGGGKHRVAAFPGAFVACPTQPRGVS